MVRAEGFEPPTPSSEDWCSIQLSYARIKMFVFLFLIVYYPAMPAYTERRNHNANIDVRQSIQYYFRAHASVAQR